MSKKPLWTIIFKQTKEFTADVMGINQGLLSLHILNMKVQ